VRAGISIPGLFFPIKNKGRVLVDASVIDPIPTEVLRQAGADIVIAVNVNSVTRKKPIFDEEAVLKDSSDVKIPNLLKNLSRSVQIIGSETSRADLIENKADFLIDIDLQEDIKLLDFSNLKKLIEKGESAAREYISQIKKLTEPNILKDFLNGIKEGLGIS
jgi:NTE family protein